MPLKARRINMKNIVLSTVAVLAMGSFAVAGGNVAPVEEVVEAPVVVSNSGPYIGIAYGYMMNEQTMNGTDYSFDENYNSVMLQGGYKFNDYVAVEGRYWFGVDSEFTVGSETFDQSIDSWGIYVKPMYPVTEEFNVYALLGYASSQYNNTTSARFHDATMDGFSWGLGASYAVSDNVDLFVDYVSLYNDDTEISPAIYNEKIETVNFGVTYKF